MTLAPPGADKMWGATRVRAARRAGPGRRPLGELGSLRTCLGGRFYGVEFGRGLHGNLFGRALEGGTWGLAICGGRKGVGLLGKDLGEVSREGFEGLCWLRSATSGTFQGLFKLGIFGVPGPA